MADFITRLAERTLETAPVVQPPIPSMFAPEPATRSMGLAWDEETLAPSDDPDRTIALPVVAPSPKKVPEDTATTQSEEQGVHVTLPLASGTSDVSVDPRRLAESRSSGRGVTSEQEGQSTAPSTPNSIQRTPDAAGPDSFEGKVASQQEDRQSLSSGSYRGTPESRPRPSHLDEPGSPERRGTLLVDNGQSVTRLPKSSPGTRASLDTDAGTMGSEAIPVSAPPATAPLVTPGVVRPQLNDELERGPREPHVAAPESPAPTIRVAIGRIEVRAITAPPAPPTRRTAPVPPGPELSLDDYLKQRNGGQR
jgi:hypothetical protein